MLDVLHQVPPGALLALGALLAAFLPARLRRIYLVALPILSVGHLAACFTLGDHTEMQLFDLTLTPVRVDRLALVWGYVFHFAAFVIAIYQWNENRCLTPVASLSYAGGAISAVFAGDLLTLFVGWEWTALTSVFLIWNGESRDAAVAGIRYLLWQVGSGVLLLAGAILLFQQTGNLLFGAPNETGIFTADVGTWPVRLILAAMAIKAGFPLLNTWLPDGYPTARPAGTVVLSVFTTKLAIYALLRGFAGWTPLVAVGCVMAIVPLIQALVDDDARRTLIYCLINQLGFMVVATGIGTPLAINGVAAHAVGHILYKSLLLMAIGSAALLHSTTRISQLGGLAQQMPWVCAAYLWGAASMTLPLLCGFVTKSLSLSAIAEAHQQTAWLILWVATAGVFFVCGLRIPYEIFFRCPQHKQIAARQDRANIPVAHYVAMGLTAAACLAVGIAPRWLYQFLPNAIEYHPYTIPHIIGQLQLMTGAALAFVIFNWLRVYPVVLSAENWDVDYLWRRAANRFMEWAWRAIDKAQRRVGLVSSFVRHWAAQRMERYFHEHGPRGLFASTGQMACMAAIMLIIFLIAYYRQ